MDEHTCRLCSVVFTCRRKPGARPRYCSSACRTAANIASSRASWLARKDDPDVKARAAEYSHRSHLKRMADPVSLARQRAATAAWRAANGPQMAEYEHRYRQENAEQVQEKNRKRRATLLSAWVEDVSIDDLWERDGGICGLCAEPIDRALVWPDKLSLTMDHVIPLAHGGVHSVANTQIAHAVCNSRKNDRIPESIGA